MEPHALLYLARPLAVRPAPCDAGFFSPRLTDRLTLQRFFFLAMLVFCQQPSGGSSLLLGQTFYLQVGQVELEEVIKSEEDEAIACLHSGLAVDDNRAAFRSRLVDVRFSLT